MTDNNEITEQQDRYKDSRNRIVFSEFGGENEGIRQYSNGDIVHLELFLDHNLNSSISKNRIFFKDDKTNSTFMAFNDSPIVMKRLIENYGIEKGGKIIGDFEIFWNSTTVDLLVPND